jgi:hypothetical protein
VTGNWKDRVCWICCFIASLICSGFKNNSSRSLQSFFIVVYFPSVIFFIMKLISLLLISSSCTTYAFPGMGSREEMAKRLFEERQVNHVKKREAKQLAERQSSGSLLGGSSSVTDLLGDTVGALTNTLEGLLGSIAESVNPDNKRPEPGYTFKAPGPNDSRGPCPGLNLLANYGYLPRNGIVNMGQVLEATARGFNMGVDLATVLTTFAVLTDGDIATETWALGTSGNGNVGGLNRHSTVEADVSPSREDYYLGCGDSHHLSSRLFKQNLKYVAASNSRQFDLNVMGDHFAESAAFSKLYNPYLYYCKLSPHSRSMCKY